MNKEQLRHLNGANKADLIKTILQQEELINNTSTVAKNFEDISQNKTKEALLGLLEKVVPICSDILTKDYDFTEEQIGEFRSKFFIGLRAKIAEIQTVAPVKTVIPRKKSRIIL